MKRDYTPYQKKIIHNYYDRQDTILLNRLQELASELYLAEGDKQKEQLWKRVGQALKGLNFPDDLAAHILEKRDVQVLVRNIEDRLKI